MTYIAQRKHALVNHINQSVQGILMRLGDGFAVRERGERGTRSVSSQ